MNFLGFRPNAFIISKKIRFHFFEIIKDEAALKVWYAIIINSSKIVVTILADVL
jgi:hypothetical protein